MIAIKVPPLGESVVEATVSRWTKKPGDPIAAGDTIVELETDKVTVEVPALKAGVLTSQAKREGELVKVDELLGEMDDSPAAVAAASAATPATASAAVSAAHSTTVASPAAATVTGATAGLPLMGSPVRASPAAQRLAAREGIDLAQVPGSGRGGVV